MERAKGMAAAEAPRVEEMSGLDGAFVFSELLLQRVWLRGAFLRAGAMTQDGRAVELLHPGRWNRRGGPDFLGARLRIGGVDTAGDVELHLREQDWAAHGHSADPAYAGVVLHVVLFPPREARLTAGVGGAPLPVLALLPLLPFDLEEHALDEAAEALAGRPAGGDCAALLSLAPADCIEILDTHARARWEAKRTRAAEALVDFGWEGACHRAALAALGYSRNRVPMTLVAERHPLADWVGRRVEPLALYRDFASLWHRGGRPANHPLRRLEQYSSWVARVPDWPRVLLGLGRDLCAEAVPGLPPAGAGAGESARALPPGSPAPSPFGGVLSPVSAPGPQSCPRQLAQPLRWPWGVRCRGFGRRRELWLETLCGGILPGPRFDTLVCDVFLPLLAASAAFNESRLHLSWMTWCPGDLSDGASSGLRRVFRGLEAVQVNCNGAHQGFIGWGLERRRLGAA